MEEKMIIVGKDKFGTTLKRIFKKQTYNARWKTNNTIYSGKTPQEAISNLLKGIPYGSIRC